MIVRIYDFLSAEKPKFSENLVGIVSDVTKFKYTRRAYDIGSFEMEVPTHANDAEYIQPDKMLIVGEKLSETYISGDPTRRIVNGTFLYVTEVDKNDQTITVTGYDLKYLFASRVTLFPAEEQDKGTYGYYVVSGTTFSCISNLINYNIVNATDSDRQIFGMSAITMPTTQVEAGLTGIQDDRYMTRLEPLSTAIFNLLKNCKTHFYDVRLLIDDNADDADNYNPHLESSEDKPTIIIDESRYNIKSYTRKDGTSAYKNAIYAVSGTGDDVVVKCVKREGDTASGIKRKEVVLDVDTDSVSEIDRYAIKAAEDYNISDDFEIEPLFDDDDAEPTLAQKVLIRIDGVDYETVITEITDEYSDGKHTQSYVCGDKKLKVLNVLNKATAGNTQKIIDNKINIGNKGGVGKICGNGTSEQFNDYSTANIDEITRYSHIVGRNNTITGGDYDTIIGKGNTIKNVLSNSEKGYQGTRYGQGSVVTGTSNTTVQSVNTLVSGRNNYVGRSYWNPATDSMVIGRGNKVYGGMSGSAVIGYNNETPSSEYIDVISLSGSLIAGRDNQVKRGDVYSSFIIGNENKADLSDVYTALKIKKSMSQSVMIGTSNTNECVQGAYTIGHFNHQYSYTSESTTGKGQFAIGVGLKNGMPNNFVMGYYNKKYENGRELNLPFSFGYGTSDDDRKNLIELDEAGNLWIAGSLTEGSGGGGGYSLPAATSTTLGGVKIGNNISVADDGTISVDLSTYLQSADIADWAKQPNKPVYTADEVGAAAEQHTHSTADITDFPAIPTKVSELQNDSGYISEETDPTVPAWAKAETKPTYTASEVGAAAKSHTHSKSDITDFPTAMKNPSALTVQMNGTTAAEYDGGTAKTVNITPSGIGAATSDDVTAAINAVEIGGTQILKGTNTVTVLGSQSYKSPWKNGGWRAASGGTGTRESITITDAPEANIKLGWELTQSAGTLDICQDDVPIASGQTYTASCYARGTGRLRINCGKNPYRTKYFDFDNAGGWIKCANTFVASEATTGSASELSMYFGNVSAGTLQICGMKLETGSKATGWNEAQISVEARLSDLEERVTALEAAALAGGE